MPRLPLSRHSRPCEICYRCGLQPMLARAWPGLCARWQVMTAHWTRRQKRTLAVAVRRELADAPGTARASGIGLSGWPQETEGGNSRPRCLALDRSPAVDDPGRSYWRRRRDSNPRSLTAHPLSRRRRLTAPALLRRRSIARPSAACQCRVTPQLKRGTDVLRCSRSQYSGQDCTETAWLNAGGSDRQCRRSRAANACTRPKQPAIIMSPWGTAK